MNIPQRCRFVLAALTGIFLLFAQRTLRAEVADLDTVSAGYASTNIAAGADHACALSTTGVVSCWGRNHLGQLGRVGASDQEPAPVTVDGLTDVVSVTAGGNHTCALKEDGTVWCWGDNTYGQLGIGSFATKEGPTLVPGLTEVRSVVAGANHTCAISNIALYCWGKNDLSQLGLNAPGGAFNVPQQVVNGVRSVHTGPTANHTCAVQDGDITYCWGDNSRGQVGNGAIGGTVPAPTSISLMCAEGACTPANLSLSRLHTCAYSPSGGSVHCWGDNTVGQVDWQSSAPVWPLPHLLAEQASGIVVGDKHTCGRYFGYNYCWGSNVHGQLGADDDHPVAVGIQAGGAVVAGARFSCGLQADGDLYCWGANDYGQLGATSYSGGDHMVPQHAVELTYDVSAISSQSISAAQYHTCAKRADRAQCWGYNGYGQLGNGTTSSSPSPVDVSLSDVATVAVGRYHSCAIRADGTVWCWGRNIYGGVGTGSIGGNYPTPVQVQGVSDAIAIDLGKYHTCARTATLETFCWGYNGYGEVGVSAGTNQGSPVSVGEWRHIALGEFHTCGVTPLGEAKCWGRNSDLQLGNTGGHTHVPQLVAGLGQSVSTMSASYRHTCAVLGNSDLYCWGNNSYKQLGFVGSSTATPTLNTQFGHVTHVVASSRNVCAENVASHHTKCWGANNELQLGDGSTDRSLTRSTPGAVAATTRTKVLSGRYSVHCAIGYQGDVQCWGSNGNGQIGNGVYDSSDAPTPTNAVGFLCSPDVLNGPDGNPCSHERCVVTTSGPSYEPDFLWDDAPCDDGVSCNGRDRCVSGVCQSDGQSHTDIGDPCMIGTCTNDVLGEYPRPTGFHCDDGDACTTLDSCDGAGSCGGTPTSLDDGNPCTIDACGPNGPTHTPVSDGTPCLDADICNGMETCQAGVCVGGAPPELPSGDDELCRVWSCHPGLGPVYENKSAGTNCSDGVHCNGLETCDGNGQCVAGTAPSLNDSNECTDDICVASTGEVNPPLPRGAGCTGGACDGAGRCVSGALSVLPPDPATVAPPKSGDGFGADVEFLYGGANPIQTGVQPGVLEDYRVAVVRGKVMGRHDGEDLPLPDVSITIKDHPEFGGTVSREDGTFDVAVNGGGTLVVEFSHADYIRAHRKVIVPWNEFAYPDSVTLLQRDASTEVTLGSASGYEVHTSTPTTDMSGTRQAKLLLPKSASVEGVRDGQVVQLPQTVNVRATEFTVGTAENDFAGEAAMPGELPPHSLYTYAVELSLDEAEAVNADEVRFTEPVPVYVDNFLDFPVGTPVPAGYYDRVTGAWTAGNSGQVIEILGTTGGLADVNIDGDAQPESTTELAAIGIDDAERAELALEYTAGTKLWRVEVDHFTPWDFNWGGRPPPCSEGGPCEDDPTGGVAASENVQCSNTQAGSIIECENRVLGEEIPVAGTPYSLVYRSSRVDGYRHPYTFRVNLPPRANAKRVKYHVSTTVGGKFQRIEAGKFAKYVDFHWDGLDPYGRLLEGKVKVGTQVKEYYYADYEETGVFGVPNDIYRTQSVPPSLTGGRGYVILWRNYAQKLDLWKGRDATIGGWTMDVHHSYDAGSNKLHLGSGDVREVDGIGLMMDFYDVGGPSRSVAVGADGSVYFSRGHVLHSGRFVDGELQSQAMSDELVGQGFAGDGGPVASAVFRYINDLEVGADGSVYVADNNNGRVRRVDSSGIVTTVAGGGLGGPGDPATSAALADPIDIAVASDGTLYVVDRGVTPTRLYSVAPDGILRVLAEDDGLRKVEVGPDDVPVVLWRDAAAGELGYQLHKLGSEGVSVVARDVHSVHGSFAIDTQGRFYLPHAGYLTLIDGDGDRTTIAGCAFGSPNCLDFSNGATRGPAEQRYLTTGMRPAVGPDGAIYLTSDINYLRVVRQPALDMDTNEVRVPSSDGTAYYRFDTSGRHVGTRDATTGSDLLTFGYDAGGRLSSITDADGLTTNINYVADAPSTIVGPYGQTTTLTTTQLSSGKHYLSRVDDPKGGSFTMTYEDPPQLPILQDYIPVVDASIPPVSNPEDPSQPLPRVPPGPAPREGLLSSFTNRNGFTSTFEYDGLGKLASDTGPVGDYQQLTHCELSPNGVGDCACDARVWKCEDQGGAEVCDVFDGDWKCAEPGHLVVHTSAEGRETKYLTRTTVDGEQERIATPPSGVAGRTLSRTDGTVRTEYPHCAGGTCPQMVTESESELHPIWAESAPYESKTTTTFPSGRTVVETATHEIVANFADPTLVDQSTDVKTTAGRIMTVHYDRLAPGGPTVTTTPPSGKWTKKDVLDSLGRPIRIEGPGTLPIEIFYDADGRVEEVRHGTRVAKSSYVSSGPSRGYLESVENSLLETVSFTADALGRTTAVQSPDTSTASFLYLPDGQVDVITPPGGTQHEFGHTPHGAVAAYVPPQIGGDSWPSLYSYNRDKAPLGAVEPNGDILLLEYDTAGRPLRGVSSSGDVQATYYSASCASPDCFGGAVQHVTGPGVAEIHFGYDGALPLWVESRADAATITGRVSWEYDSHLEIESETVAVGALTSTWHYEYDIDGVLRCVSQSSSCQAGADTLQFNLDSSAPRPTAASIGILSETIGYNAYGELASYSVSDGTRIIYEVTYDDGTDPRDTEGRVTAKKETIWNGTASESFVDRYTYDNRGRLTNVATSDGRGPVSYGYDSNGNRLSRVDSTSTEAGVYDAQDRATSYGDLAFSFDEKGDLTSATASGGTHHYTYDAFGDLRAVSLADGRVVSYDVDGSGRRIAKRVDGVVKRQFLYGADNGLKAEIDENGVVARYVYGQTRTPELLLRDGVVYRLVKDQLDSVVMVVDTATGSIAQRARFDEYGRLLEEHGSRLTSIGFAGGLYDEDTGLVRFGARDYDAYSGRWLRKDPVRFDGGLNHYAYIGNEPVNGTDPTGLWRNSCTGRGSTWCNPSWVASRGGVVGAGLNQARPAYNRVCAMGAPRLSSIASTTSSRAINAASASGGPQAAVGGGSRLLLQAPSATRAFQSLGSLRGMSFRGARDLLQRHGFRLVGRSEGGYTTFRRVIQTGTRGGQKGTTLQVTIRPNGQVIRSVRGTGQRFDALGRQVTDHAAGESLGGNFLGVW